MRNVLDIDGVLYSYDKNRVFSFPNISCKQGEHLLVTGSSGCGKTTCLHLIAGMIKPNSGTIKIKGKDITKLSSSELDKYRGEEIGIVFQVPHFIKSLTAQENLMIAMSLNHRKIDKKRIEELFNSLNISHCLNSKVTQMSQGELQRLSIARAVVNKPSLILADEPTSSLDDENCKEAINLLRTQAEMLQASLLIVTHDNRLADSFTQKVHLKA